MKGTNPMKIRQALVGALSALALAVSPVALLAPTATADPGGCGTMQVIAAPGTTETHVGDTRPMAQRGLMGNWGQQLQQRVPGAQVQMVSYPAQVGGPVAGLVTGQQTPEKASVGQGYSTMQTMLQQTAARCPGTPIVLSGYSQGAQIAGDLCSSVGQGKVAGVQARQIRSCELFGDPKKGSGDKTMGGRETPFSGLLGNGRDMGELANRTYQACEISDPICSYRATEVAQGLGGNPQVGANSPQAQSIATQLLSFKPQYGGSNSIWQVAADAIGPWAAFQSQHTGYATGTNFGGTSAVGSSVDRLASGKVSPLSAPSQQATNPVAQQQAQTQQVAQAIPGLTALFSGVRPMATSATPSATSVTQAAGRAAPTAFAGGVQPYGLQVQPGAGMVVPSAGASTPGLQNVDAQGLGTVAGILAGVR
ncbi:cutinase family protein [Tsukamurella conjunctivitidis]|uniref:Cutinase n=3 Tax=Tsukamurella TaxID=2060 RepID=A0A5C5RPM8_9ACTN|nr:cutinase family protein [Tsukamurella conjunctivitidis]